MNVLVYSGPEVVQASLTQTLASLRSLLLPHYSVQPIAVPVLLNQPWTLSCSLFVVPACSEPFISSANTLLMDFVNAGGSLLAFAAGVEASQPTNAFGMSGLTLSSMGMAGEKTLRFADKVSGAYVYPILGAYPERPGPTDLETARHVNLWDVAKEEEVRGVYQLGRHRLEEMRTARTLKVLVRLLETQQRQEVGASRDSEGEAAGILWETGAGRVAIWNADPEFSLLNEPASLTTAAIGLTGDSLEENEKRRSSLLKTTLGFLGLQLPGIELAKITQPLPQFLTCSPRKPTIVSAIAQALGVSLHKPTTYEDVNDTFLFQPIPEGAATQIESARTTSNPDPANWQPKHVYLCPDGYTPSRRDTPLFNIHHYYEYLNTARTKEGLADAATTPNAAWGIGEAFAYGEVVTSTQTLLDKNPKLLSSLPTPFVSFASFQLRGRGRGNNAWISPAGLLMFSIHTRVSLSSFPAAKLVFVQYLFGLAVVEACRDESVLGKFGERVRLKWPNDIYAVGTDESDKKQWKKIGGILVNTSFSGGKADIVIGCGLDVLNAPPIMSFSQLIPPDVVSSLTIEGAAATILVKFEKMWNEFTASGGSFAPFIGLYRKRWLHSDQLITLSTVSPPRQVRISSITLDYGLLRTVPERGYGGSGVGGGGGLSWSVRGETDDEYIDLQPDGNSFDLMAGMIKAKN